ncbi:5-formyltetrahydrofolate cyclo-ligase [Sphingomonas crusticola]|uniref:5-formyltetrahydrofolate cyclo-ligase n=1 Tax=Sphingomonas crusticola TaxID=1697973 RepID=UPI000E27A216|nr:5-formyltetrahydrofolate cyclo-ligase [Sphingomonas crusticola]
MAVPPPSPDPLAPDPAKIALREHLRARRSAHVEAIGADGAQSAAEAAARHILPHIPRGATVSLYLALKDELDPGPLIAQLHARGHELALPALFDGSSMRFLAWAPGDPIERGPMRLRQPLSSAPERAPDLIVTPLLGFDRAGRRIGYGAGHYDRAFQRFPGAHRIGLTWAGQEVARIPHDPWDVPLHAITTEQEFIIP